MPRIRFAALVSTAILTIWPLSGQEVTPNPPANTGVCFHIQLVVPKSNVDSAMVLKKIENRDKGMSLVRFPPSSCEQNLALTQKMDLPVAIGTNEKDEHIYRIKK